MGGGALILVDTHVLVWIMFATPSLGRRSKETIDRAFGSDGVVVSAMSFWEVAMLARKNRITLSDDVPTWRSRVLKLGIVEIPISGDIAITAAELPRFHSDPADRVIVATATLSEAMLMTADQRILSWKQPMRRLDARQ